MNKFRKLLLLIAILLCKSGSAQITDTIEVGFYKSVYLIFSDQPEVVDAGSEHLSVRLNNNRVILQILDADAWEQTSLFVENNGIAYYFIIDYNDNPKKHIYEFGSPKKTSTTTENKVPGEAIQVVGPEKTVVLPNYYAAINDSLEKKRKDSIMELTCITLINSPDRIGNRGIVKYKFGYYLRDMVIVDNKAYLKFEVMNRSNIEFRRDLEIFKVINVKRRIKGSVEQIVPLIHFFEYNVKPTIKGKDQYYYVIVVDKFVLTKDKKLNIQMWEENGSDLNEEGGRKMVFDVFYSDILKMGVL